MIKRLYNKIFGTKVSFIIWVYDDILQRRIDIHHTARFYSSADAWVWFIESQKYIAKKFRVKISDLQIEWPDANGLKFINQTLPFEKINLKL